MKTWVNGVELCDNKFQKQGHDAPRAPHSLFTPLRNIYINRKKIGFMSFLFQKNLSGQNFLSCPETGQGCSVTVSDTNQLKVSYYSLGTRREDKSELTLF